MDRRKWLLRLIPLRAVTFTVFVLAEPSGDMYRLLAVVYALSFFWYALLRAAGSPTPRFPSTCC
jgi:hypothetical protein